ncbi:MAG: hypothetical protein LBU32_20540 [Clostridiales bacterium]|jgi:predicted site-specific integrase-resolvase|nr:hypothetical protein [Clostridiales bacterium]
MENLASIEKAAKMLGVSETALRRWDYEGKLPSIKAGAGAMIHQSFGRRRPANARRWRMTERLRRMPGRRAMARKRIWSVKDKHWSCFAAKADGHLS